MDTYLLDTNVVSAYLNLPKLVDTPAGVTARLRQVHDRVAALASPIFSALTVWEIERGLTNAAMTRHLRAFRTLCIRATVLPVDDGVLKVAVDVWCASATAGRRPGDMDALLIATARRWGYVFVSDDDNALACAALQVPPVPAENWFRDA